MSSFLSTTDYTDKTIRKSRLLPIEGAYNIRDLGGYKTFEDKTVKWGKIFRSGDLNKLTDTDLEYLTRIPIRTYIDFRDSAEISAAPDKKPDSLRHQYFLPIKTGNIIDFTKVNLEMIPILLVEGNKILIRDNQDVYGKFFQILMTEEDTPLLFHCSAGKDRAGLGAALFLSSLGVDREIIFQDYLLTNKYLKDKYKPLLDSMPDLAPLLMAKKEYLQAAFDVIDNEYEGMENYLKRELQVDLEKMRALYTE